MNRSETAFSKARGLLVGGVNSPVRAFGAVGGTPLFISRGKGCRVWDIDGNIYWDYLSSWGPLILGHAHPHVVKAISQAVRRGTSFGAPTEMEMELAALIREAVPTMERVRLVSSGTEATMSALRLARGVTGRDKIIKFSGCYHGHSDSLLVSAGSGALSFGYPSSAGVPQDFARHTVVCPYNEISAVEEAFHRFRHEIACVIVEPVAGNMGVVLPQKGFLARLRQVTERHGALLVFDEVITGFRLGWGGAQNLFKIEPDITCLGKIVGGGLPMGVFGGPARIMEKLSPLGPVYQAGTLSGNPVAVAAGLKTLRILKSLNPYRALELKTRTLAEGLRACAKKAGRAVQVNQIGSMLTLFFGSDPVRDLASAQACDAKMYGRFFHALLDRGVYIPPSPFEALFVSTAHSIKDIQETLKRVDAAFENL